MLSLGLIVSSPAALAKSDPLTPQQRSKAIEDIAATFEQIYVFPDVGSSVASDLRMRLRRGDYEQVSESADLAELLSAHIDAICHDVHTKVAYVEEDALAAAPPADPAAAKRRSEEHLAKAATENFDFAVPKRLDGNVSLIKFDGFYRAAEVGPLVQKYMNESADADALIFDLRENGGGSPEIIALIASYLYDDEPVHLYDQSNRRERTDIKVWTDPKVAGKRFGSKKPVFILTGKDTYSAAESFAYTLQQLKRARVVGEVTRGGAHGAFGRPVTSHLIPFVATSRTVNAVSHSDWNRTGVVPDIAVPAVDALDAALKLAKPATGSAR